ncbi:rod shape-determining protein [Streptomyces sp. Ru73]|uniref:rod shape-determining protein n=1 Tax=Streptomyces sp. Ru73 TaxID=2080748 RepID=UPI000CDE3E53|nr:rod shape-determining protein [Streptomyces sp. Ru73]POX39408.1 rod shape-determining protein [Streptomyces sp. Ru73]
MASTSSGGTYDIGIDLGTANTLVYARGKGVVLDEPSVVAVNATGDVIAVGTEAKRTIGRTPSGITAMRPLRDGVIADFDAAERMLRGLMKKALPGRRFSRPRVVICVPSGITGVERRAVVDSARRAGAREVQLIEEPMAAAIGAGLPVAEPVGCMVVDIGGGTTEVAVVSMGGLVTAESVRVAGDAMDAAVMAYVKRKHALAIGERTAEDIKIAIGSAMWTPEEVHLPEPAADGAEEGDAEDTVALRVDTCTVRGRDNVNGLPRTQEITAEEVRQALAEPVDAIVQAVRRTLDACPPELSGDVIEHGIALTGGGALLRGLDRLLTQETGVPVVVAEDPLNCVVAGTGKCVEEFATMNGLLADAKTQPRRAVRL